MGKKGQQPENDFIGEDDFAEAGKTELSPEGVSADDPSILTRTKELLHSQKLITIEIPSTERDRSAVTVTVNGLAFNIPRDKPVQVPEAVVHVLENAKFSTFSSKKREGGEGNELVESVTQRHAYIVKGN